MKKYIIANWKMNPVSIEETRELVLEIARGVKDFNAQDLEVVICPPFPFLSSLKSEIGNMKLGAQNCFWENQGAFTGEISPLMLEDVGCEYVIAGHSERRIHLGETDEMIAKKIRAAQESGLKVVLCIGENLDQRKAGQTREVLESQLRADLREMRNLLVVYEPIWAISSFNGHVASAQTTLEATNWIREFLQDRFGEQGREIPVLYGGSVTAKNANEHVCEAVTDGFLVGNASLNAKEFLRIVEIARC